MDGPFTFALAVGWLVAVLAISFMFYPFNTAVIVGGVLTLWSLVRVAKFIVDGN